MITIQKDSFLSAIRAVKGSVAKIGLNPILSSIHIKSTSGGLVLTTTDCTNAAQAVVEANVTGSIEFCISADKLESIVNCLDRVITIDLQESLAIIKSGKTKFEVLILNSKEFPMPEFDLSGEKVVLSKNEFIAGVNKAIIATTAIDNHILSGVCFTFKKDSYEIATTDGNRLCLVSYDAPQTAKGQYIIPKKILIDAIKNIGGDVELYFDANKITIKTGICLYTTMLLSGAFPAYSALIPQNQPLRAIIKKSDLLSALEKVAVMCDEKRSLTVFDFTKGQLSLTTASENGKAEDVFEIDFNNKLKIAFNYKYILDCLKVVDTDTVAFEMANAESSCLIRTNFVYLVMPMKV